MSLLFAAGSSSSASQVELRSPSSEAQTPCSISRGRRRREAHNGVIVRRASGAFFLSSTLSEYDDLNLRAQSAKVTSEEGPRLDRIDSCGKRSMKDAKCDRDKGHGNKWTTTVRLHTCLCGTGLGGCMTSCDSHHSTAFCGGVCFRRAGVRQLRTRANMG